jgi:iron complex transport system substrate-binding protein
MGMNRILAGIALCSLLFCCTLPAAASDFTLGIFGNANEGEMSHIRNG